jgi:hypothetical protein
VPFKARSEVWKHTYKDHEDALLRCKLSSRADRIVWSSSFLDFSLSTLTLRLDKSPSASARLAGNADSKL